MKSSVVIITILMKFADATAQLSGSVEQLHYFEKGENFSAGPIAQLWNQKDWYAELRYNYEEEKTFSFYVGRVYSKEAEFSYSLIPLIGGVLGRFKGGSAGLDIDLNYKDFFFASQSQYTFSVEDEISNFYFSWSEAGYQPLTWLYAGPACQLTYYPQIKETSFHPGFVVGLCYKQWTFPIYGFSITGDNRTLVCGILWEWTK